MWSYNEYGVIGSLLEPIPLIRQTEIRFDGENALQWLNTNLKTPVIVSAIYLLLVHGGIRWMSTREPYKLKQILLLWNIGLAVFSIFGTLSLLPSLLHGAVKHGVYHAICLAKSTDDPSIAYWGFIFVISKVFEFLDTLFLILRKRSVSFLHWYHHTTVLVYSWYVLGTWAIGSGHVFAAMNYAVHSLMYTYYFLRSASVFIPSGVALFITILQISQMFVGLAVNVFLYYQKIVLEEACNITPYVIYIGLIVYGSYAVLFIKFFMDRYIWKANTKKD